MDKPQKIGGWKKRAQWAINVGEVALGLKPAAALMAPKKNAPSEFSIALPKLEPQNFTDLPKEMQNKILGILIADQNVSDFQEAAMTIDALAGVNKELNSLFNDPQFCLTIIKNLAKRFDVSDELAAKVLDIKSAKKRLALQKKLIKAIRDKDVPAQEILVLIQQDVDVNFTMIDQNSDNHSAKSPLYIASFYPGPLWR